MICIHCLLEQNKQKALAKIVKRKVMNFEHMFDKRIIATMAYLDNDDGYFDLTIQILLTCLPIPTT